METTVHSALRGGKNSLAWKQLLGRVGQEVQGGEPPPCPRIALSRDLRVAFDEKGKFPELAPWWGFYGELAFFHSRIGTMRTSFCQDMAFWAHCAPDMERSDMWAQCAQRWRKLTSVDTVIGSSGARGGRRRTATLSARRAISGPSCSI